MTELWQMTEDTAIMPLSVREAVDKLDAISGGEPDGDHGAADQILLAAVPAGVRKAYLRLVQRAEWWATA